MHGVSIPGNCPAWLRPSAARLWKTFRSKPNTIPVDGRKCSPSHRNGVRLQSGMLFGFTTEWCSPSQRNRVRLRPDSPLMLPPGAPRCVRIRKRRFHDVVGDALQPLYLLRLKCLNRLLIGRDVLLLVILRVVALRIRIVTVIRAEGQCRVRKPQFQVVDAMLLDERKKIHQRSRLCLPCGIAPPQSLKGEGDGVAVVNGRAVLDKQRAPVAIAGLPYTEVRDIALL